MSITMMNRHLQRIELLVDVLHDGRMPTSEHRLAPVLDVDCGVVVAVQVGCAFDV